MNKVIYRFLSAIVAVALTMGSYFNVSALSTSAVSTSLSEISLAVLASKIIYVNSNGSDSNSGVAASPFKTLAKGVSVLAAGDTLIVTGTFNESLIVSQSGTASSPINIIGSATVLNMNSTKPNGINISGNYVNITGFDVVGSTSHAVLISGKHIKFENSSVHHSVTENGRGTCTGAGSWGSAVKVMVGAEDVIVRGNAIYENCGEGIGITRGVSILVENNVVRDNYSVNIYLDNSPYSSANNNVVSCTGIYLRGGNRATGISIAEELYSGWGAQRHDNNVLNNTVNGCYDGITSWVPEVSGGKLINAVISGNVITNGQRKAMVISSVNENVLIENNQTYNEIQVNSAAGVTLRNNTISGVASTVVPMSTATSVLPTITQTSVPATATSVTLMSPTVTQTSVPATATSVTLMSPTVTQTSVPVTATSITPISPIATQTSVPVTATLITPILPIATQTSVPVTATLITPILPTVTQTSVPVTATSIAPTATKTSAPTAVPTLILPATSRPGPEVIYDDTNSSFTYSDGWQDVSSEQAYNGSYKVNPKIGASATLNFTGQSFSILYTDGSAYRRMSVYIDGQLVETLLRTTSKVKYQQRWDYSGQLSAGAHTIQLVFANGHATFDAVITR